MSKFVSYYSIIITALAILICLFGEERGDILGGIIFTPVLYSLWTMTIELKGKEIEENKKEKAREFEEIREEIREEIKKEMREGQEAEKWKKVIVKKEEELEVV